MTPHDAADPVTPSQLNHVKHGDIMPFARKNCGNCFGSGEFTKFTPVPGQSGTRTAKICHCALRRFMKLRAAEVEIIRSGEHKGALVWRAPPTQSKEIKP